MLLREDLLRAREDLPEAMEAIRAQALQLQSGKRKCAELFAESFAARVALVGWCGDR